MNDLFSGFSESAPVPMPLSAMEPRQMDGRPGLKQLALSPEFNALAARFDKIRYREDMREPWISPSRTVSLLRVLGDMFPAPWERCRVTEMIGVTPAHCLVDLVGSRPLAEKIADALHFAVEKLN